MRTTTRSIAASTLLALAATLVALPAAADDRGILEHQVPVEMAVDHQVFYPAQDDYLDYVDVRLYELPGTDEMMRSIDFKITDPAGGVVVSQTGNTTGFYLDGELHFGWSGRHGYSDDLYPAGTYTITLTVVDGSNDRKVMTQDVRLDHARWRVKTWRRTVGAARSVIDKDVGRCGRLERPARPVWHGSLGYRSHRCSRRTGSYAATANGIYLPRDPDRKWGSVRLDIIGGSARGRYRGSELGYAYLTNEGKWLSGMTAGSRVLRHRGLEQYKKHILGVEEGEPHFIWSVGVGGDQGYDVKAFAVVATYRIFE